MGGPKINTSYGKIKNKFGRKANKAQGKGGGKRMRKRLHNAKKAKNLDKKMLRYYGELASGKRPDELHEPQMSRGRPKLSGKKMRKIRKINQRIQQDRSRMEVEIQVTKKDAKDKTKTLAESPEPPADPSEAIEMADD